MAETRYLNRRAFSLENDNVRLTALVEGGHLAEILHKPTGVNPLWVPPWTSIEPSTYSPEKNPEYGGDVESQLLCGIAGHNLCLDLFGAPSPEEAAAGVTVHGEASLLPYTFSEANDELVQTLAMPMAQLQVERRIRLTPNGVVRISETVENLAALDRPVAWTQHVTLGPPFLERGKTRFAAPATKSKVLGGDGLEFEWPWLPKPDGTREDLRIFTSAEASGGFTTHLMDPGREEAFFVSWSPETQILFGYLWMRADFPWLGIWEENRSRHNAPWNGRTLTRGMEFGASPMPESRRAMIDRGRLFGAPAYRWIPARQRVRVDYCAFIATADHLPDQVHWDGADRVAWQAPMRWLFGKLARRLAVQEPWKRYQPGVAAIRLRQERLASLDSEALHQHATRIRERVMAGDPLPEVTPDWFALAAVAAERVLGLAPFDVQLIGALALADGKIAEMQTGEGKTLAAVLPVSLHALAGAGVHVMTANDYLARRDAEWMAPLYRQLGVSVSALSQSASLAERQQAYAADVTYGTANEFGFDLLRDHLRPRAEDLVQTRPFHFALIDEVDSILIDEARIPLVIAGGEDEAEPLAYHMARLVRGLQPGVDYSTDEHGRNVHLTEHGSRHAEQLLHRGNLYVRRNLHLLTALNAALHARALLRRDVDYVVKEGAIRLVDELKGRVARDRRWPDGIQAALEAKEGLRIRRGGRILASITVQNLVGLYPRVAGMTGTAATQAEEFRHVYSLEVVVVPTNRPVDRQDHPDVVFTHRAAKERALVEEIERVHAVGRPVLVGTASVDESEGLGARLTAAGVPHHVLNARHDEQEAEIVAQAGDVGAVTISTNMAGRGVDIVLGGNPPQHAAQSIALGGLYVIGTNRHEARRIDNQLRGRAGRQGDPGESRFYISLEDDLIRRFGIRDLLPERYRHLRQDEPLADREVAEEVARAQRIVESQNLEIRRLLWKYEQLVEAQRRIVHARRRAVLLQEADSMLAQEAPERWAEVVEQVGEAVATQAERAITLAKLDELWADYLAQLTEIRDGIHWQSFAGKDPVQIFRTTIVELFDQLLDTVDREIVAAFEKVRIGPEGVDLTEAGLLETGATWTYQSTDQLYGPLSERWMKAMRPMLLKMMRGTK